MSLADRIGIGKDKCNFVAKKNVDFHSLGICKGVGTPSL